VPNRLRELAGQTPAAHVLVAALCLGLALALLLRASHVAIFLCAVGLALGALAPGPARTQLLASALLLAGLWWGSVRLAALDGSLLEPEIGRAGLSRVEVTGPARRTEFSLRVPVRVRRFGAIELDERARLDLPPGSAPPQGAILETVATITRPRGPDEDGDFDEAGYLRRQGIHVLLKASSFRVVGHRSGLGGLADRFREGVAGSLASASAGERRAVLAGVVLGEDEGLDADLKDSFRASGLYHLLSVDKEVRETRDHSSGRVSRRCVSRGTRGACESRRRHDVRSGLRPARGPRFAFDAERGLISNGLFDLDRAEKSDEALSALGRAMPPESTAVMATVAEPAVEVIDGEMAKLGGEVTRRPVAEVTSELEASEAAAEAAAREARRTLREERKAKVAADFDERVGT
jgi:hypothetical protein